MSALDGWLTAAATAALIAASAFFVVIEFALLGARRHRLEEDAPRSAAARAALRGMNELTIMLAVAQLGITVCTFALGAVTKPAVDKALGPLLAAVGLPGWFADSAAFVLSLLLVTFLHLVVGEMAPKSWAIAHPELAAKTIGLPARALARVFHPILSWINRMANRLVSASGVEPVDSAAVGGQDAATIRQLVEHSAASGTLDASHEARLAAVLDLPSLTLGDMVAGRAATAVARDATIRDVQEAALASGHLRILVARDEDTPGVVHVRDTLDQDESAPAAALVRDPLEMAGTTLASDALARMRQSGEQLAVVTSGGGMTGVVTVTDLVDRILAPGA
ncbi:CNNM domain-containing protein [Microbacterium sp. ZXX196]|uniref:CNNM domain-containing protein n=1 Tax=Microbacterium sp. ZXX196 TaxID=2609291 RepID=UPI0012B7797A|nr:CNNM domain-containing protein [Microbacterium sp. ZXX196]MTE23775.1 DUF21 domain-containing protein [Microbacterium sp. ZXX196]